MGLLRGMRAQPEMTSPEPEVSGNDVTGTESDRKCGGHVIWRGKPLTSGKIDRGLRLRKERTCRDADMTCPLARVENR